MIAWGAVGCWFGRSWGRALAGGVGEGGGGRCCGCGGVVGLARPVRVAGSAGACGSEQCLGARVAASSEQPVRASLSFPAARRSVPLQSAAGSLVVTIRTRRTTPRSPASTRSTRSTPPLTRRSRLSPAPRRPWPVSSHNAPAEADNGSGSAGTCARWAPRTAPRRRTRRCSKLRRALEAPRSDDQLHATLPEAGHCVLRANSRTSPTWAIQESNL